MRCVCACGCCTQGLPPSPSPRWAFPSSLPLSPRLLEDVQTQQRSAMVELRRENERLHAVIHSLQVEVGDLRRRAVSSADPYPPARVAVGEEGGVDRSSSGFVLSPSEEESSGELTFGSESTPSTPAQGPRRLQTPERSARVPQPAQPPRLPATGPVPLSHIDASHLIRSFVATRAHEANSLASGASEGSADTAPFPLGQEGEDEGLARRRQHLKATLGEIGGRGGPPPSRIPRAARKVDASLLSSEGGGEG